MFAPFEQLSRERFDRGRRTTSRRVNVTRAALPIMRKQRSLHPADFVCGAGSPSREARPITPPNGLSAGFTNRSRRKSPLRCQVCALELAECERTGRARAPDSPQIHPDYERSVGAVVKALDAVWGHEDNDRRR